MSQIMGFFLHWIIIVLLYITRRALILLLVLIATRASSRETSVPLVCTICMFVSKEISTSIQFFEFSSVVT
jgi:hypothetical protein